MNRRSFLALLSAATANAVTVTATQAQVTRFGLPIGSHRDWHLPPQEGRQAIRSFRFVAFGDMGTGEKEQFALADSMARHHSRQTYDTVLMLGDNIYPDGEAKHFLPKFEQPYGALIERGVKFHATLGNHDVSKGREAQLNYKHFNMGGRAFRSFTKGDGLVEFFAIDSNNFDQEQERWLAGALAASQARWKLAYFHHPIYSSADKHGSDEKLRAKLEPLLMRHGVAAAFSGHEHVYERTKLIEGVQYFVAGAGGKLRRGNLDRRNAFFAAGNDEVNSFMSVEVTSEQLRFQTIDPAGRILDSGTLAPREAVRSKAAAGASVR
jgi:hypothetical protein